MVYGYIRVSTNNQNISRQYEEMIKFGIEKRNIFIDKESGKDFNRESYIKLINLIKEKDLLVIKSIDRLGRNYYLILEEWRRITRDIKANICVLDMPLLDTRDNDNRLLGSFISDIVLQILSFVAENERENIKSRQREGILIAKNNGIKFGRPKKAIDGNIVLDYINKKISIDKAVELLNISKSTFYRYLKKVAN